MPRSLPNGAWIERLVLGAAVKADEHFGCDIGLPTPFGLFSRPAPTRASMIEPGEMA